MPSNNTLHPLPIGGQSFETIRKEGYAYVDKTRFISELAHYGRQYFLSRPRKFGKSLFLSTLKAFWEGRNELFHGLDIEKIEKNWVAHPVFYFDLAQDSSNENFDLENIIAEHLFAWEAQYKVQSDGTLGERFRKLLAAAKEKSGQDCVVLVDKYNNPPQENTTEHNDSVFRSFFCILKSCDAYLKFVFITGVAKVGNVSIFSDLNQLNDISLNQTFSTICGFTEQELTDNFATEISNLASKLSVTRDNCLVELEKMYAGYHFATKSTSVYNPFSLLKALSNSELKPYYVASDTTMLLAKRVKAMDISASSFSDGSIYASINDISGYRSDNPNPVPLMYLTGYLTICDCDTRRRRLTLGFPNDEVKIRFLECLCS